MNLQILDSSKMKEFAHDNFRFAENGGKFSKRVENSVGKGEIAQFEQFLCFPQCFQKDLQCRQVENKSLFGKGLNQDSTQQILNAVKYPVYFTSPELNELSIKATLGF